MRRFGTNEPDPSTSEPGKSPQKTTRSTIEPKLGQRNPGSGN